MVPYWQAVWRVIFKICVIFGVLFERRKVDKKKQTYTKTEAYKLCSRVFRIFLPNVIKIDLYNFELYRFKVGAFFLRHSVHQCHHQSPSTQSVIQTCLPRTKMAVMDGARLSTTFVRRLEQNLTTALHTKQSNRFRLWLLELFSVLFGRVQTLLNWVSKSSHCAGIFALRKGCRDCPRYTDRQVGVVLR